MESNHVVCTDGGKRACLTAKAQSHCVHCVVSHSSSGQEVHGPSQRSENNAQRCRGSGLNSLQQQTRARGCGFGTEN